MATSLSVATTKHTGTATRFTGLPKIPQNLAVAATPDEYPCSRVVRRASIVSSTTAMSTWKAQAYASVVKTVLVSAANSTMSGYPVDPDTVAWASVTRTYQRPRNPNGGIPRFTKNIGNAEYINFSGGSSFQDVFEERQPLLSGVNTWTEARKLPPLATLNLTTPAANNSYASGTLGAIYAIGVESPKAFRYLGGSILVGAVNPSGAPASVAVDVYVFPIDPGTLIGQWPGGAIVGSMTMVPFTPVTVTITQATLLGVGIVRWDQFWMVVTGVGAPAPAFSTYILYAPTDVPPPYDAPGVESFIPGGFL